MMLDTSESHLDALLSSKEDVAIYVACGIIVNDNKPHLSGQTVSKDLKKLVERDRRLAHDVEPALHKLLLAPFDGDAIDFRATTIGKEGLNDALKRIWPVYRSADWYTLPEPNDRWVTCETSGGVSIRGARSQDVHLDILQGKLLINGKPLGRLPAEFVKHPTYVRLFGEVSFSSPSMALSINLNMMVEKGSRCDSCRHAGDAICYSFVVIWLPSMASIRSFLIRKD